MQYITNISYLNGDYMIKLTFIGDIMCEPLLLKSSKTNIGYDFQQTFSYVKTLFANSDFVIGNLETPIAGKKAKYTHSLFSFNAPKEFALAVKNAGIGLVSTANNHCLDRGRIGLDKTIENLNEINLAHFGTYKEKNQKEEAFYFNKENVQIAFISYTYGTNFYENKILIPTDEQYKINLLRPQQESCYISAENKHNCFSLLKKRITSLVPLEKKIAIKKFLHKQYNTARVDNNLNVYTSEKYILQMQSDIRKAKSKADLVVFYPHLGGQFNLEPGKITEYVFQKAIEAGADVIIASHPHIIQKAKTIQNVPCFYSIGNFSMSPNSVYLLHENNPEYGLAIHIYYVGDSFTITFSVLKMIEIKNKPLEVWPIDILYERLSSEEKKQLTEDVKRIYKRITGKSITSQIIRKEYEYEKVKKKFYSEGR